jgi:streptogramin lyase
MSHAARVWLWPGIALAGLMVLANLPVSGQNGRGTQSLPPAVELAPYNAMTNPYRMLPAWPQLEGIKPGAAIGIVPDGKGGVWLEHRSVPAILHFDSSGKILKRFEVTFASSHGMCVDRDGNFWALDSGPFGDTPEAGVHLHLSRSDLAYKLAKHEIKADRQ